MNRQQFINIVAPLAVQVRVEGGPLFPSVLMAQTLLETGGMIHEWNNIVGYKVGNGGLTPYWSGVSVNTATREVIDGVSQHAAADWRAYDSVYNCLKDQALLFLNNPSRYLRVTESVDPYMQADMLYACGYATDAPAEVDGDPSYAEKLRSIIVSFEYLDEEATKAMEVIQQLQQAVQELQQENGRLSEKLQELAEKDAMPEVPEWARDAVDAAIEKRLIDTPDGGSYNFYRTLTILSRLGLL